MAIIMQGKMENIGPDGATEKDYFSGVSLFWSGLTVGFANLFCG